MEQEGEKATTENQESTEMQQENLQTSATPDLASTPVLQDCTTTEPPTPEASTPPSEAVTPITTTVSTVSTTVTTPQPQPVLQPSEPPPVNPDSQSTVYTLPDAYRGIGGDICVGYGSLSRINLHGYWPAKNFQSGAHYTLPFLRDSYAPAGLSSQAEQEGHNERGENPPDMKTNHPAANYPTLGGIHQFRPITTMELLREPSRTR